MESRGRVLQTSIGLGAAILIGCFAVRIDFARDGRPGTSVRTEDPVPKVLHFLAVGDINLGRAVGRKMLEGDTLFPFRAVQDTFARFDLVFGNLESSLSNQDGETEDPGNNLVFTGPPAGASALSLAGITMVSSANNHALDYGVDAARETAKDLLEAGIVFAGTDADSGRPHKPAIVERKGIRIALFACTDIMNVEDSRWRRIVADADTAALFPLLRVAHESADFVIVSLHGGDEYADRPTTRIIDFARSAIDAGADLVLGHHPHVPYGIERYRGRCIVHSLGNFVFYQPSRYWTLRSFGFAADIVKDSSGTRIRDFRCLPVRCGLQPVFLSSGPEADSIQERVRTLSSFDVAEGKAWRD
jgi:poly-gamma-glutamate capsule biosynthesis protein CapA/YwtB (metallophosphatase superfamily)